MLRKRPKTQNSKVPSQAVEKYNKKELDPATKQSLQDMFDHEDYLKKHGFVTSFYKVSDEDMWIWKEKIKATYEYIEQQRKTGYYGKDDGKFNKSLLKLVENDWNKEAKKRGLI